MKTLIILAAFGCLFSSNYVSAQQTKEEMLPVVTITATGTSINDKVRKAFETTFKNVENMRWYEANQNYLVKFIQGDQEHNALYRRNGSLIYHVTFGFEINLPATVRDQVKAKYHDYKIARVFNVNQDERDIWIVNLENKDFMILTRIEDGAMNEVKKLKNLTAPFVSAGKQ